MTRLSIACQSCGRAWTVVNATTVYEQQAVESCPCPSCGAYTLCCQTPAEGPPRRPRWKQRTGVYKTLPLVPPTPRKRTG